MDILPIKILTSNPTDFQPIALFVDRFDVEKELRRLIEKWRGKEGAEANDDYREEISITLKKLSLPISLYELVSDCVLSGIIWKSYNLEYLKVLDELRFVERMPKNLVFLKRDRDWYWRQRKKESYTKIAEKERNITKQGVINAIKRYKKLTGNT